MGCLTMGGGRPADFPATGLPSPAAKAAVDAPAPMKSPAASNQPIDEPRNRTIARLRKLYLLRGTSLPLHGVGRVSAAGHAAGTFYLVSPAGAATMCASRAVIAQRGRMLLCPAYELESKSERILAFPSIFFFATVRRLARPARGRRVWRDAHPGTGSATDGASVRCTG